jgi:BASS family bile acid:Na+ symporter
LLVASGILYALGLTQYVGFSIAAAFLILSIAVKYTNNYKGFSFTLVIFSAVSLSLSQPQLFTLWGDYKLTGLIVPLIQLIMFGMGTSMSMKDFTLVVQTPKGVIIGVISQFAIMPTLGFLLASISNLPPEIAAGVILIGCSPSGLASNVMSYLAKANLALSITITSITTLIAPFVTPLLMKVFAGELVEIDITKMMWDINKMILLPIGAGLIFNQFLKGKLKWMDSAMPIVSMAGIAAIITIITASGRDNLLTIGPILIGIVLIHNTLGYLLGYWSGKLFKMPEQDCRTIAIEVGMQNGGLASGLAQQLGKAATMGLAPAVFGPFMNITGSILASYWHKREPKN